MARQRCFIGPAAATIFVIGIVFLGSVPQATAETWNFKAFTHVTKLETFPVADVEGHAIIVAMREGAMVFENGEWAWFKATNIRDIIKGAGTAEQYLTSAFLDGSTITAHNKGINEAAPQGVISAAKLTGDIIHGTGRFQGIKGSVTFSAKILPPEKGEPVGKALLEGVMVYTLPSK